MKFATGWDDVQCTANCYRVLLKEMSLLTQVTKAMANNWEVLKVLHFISKVDDILLYLLWTNGHGSSYNTFLFFQIDTQHLSGSLILIGSYIHVVLDLSSVHHIPFFSFHCLHTKEEAAGFYEMLSIDSIERRTTNPIHKPGNMAW